MPSVAGTDPGKMHFDRLDAGTDEDFGIMRQVHERNLANLPDLLLSMLTGLKGDAAYPVNRLEHSVQTATRAMRDGADEELIVCALLHDVGETLGPLNHGQVGAALLRPFVSEENYWVLAHHAIFQTYFYAAHLGLNPNARDEYTDSPYYQACVDFTTNWDEVSFDADYPSEPLATFEPMVRSVLSRPWAPPG
jgi:predicted HD phosphohydrolase